MITKKTSVDQLFELAKESLHDVDAGEGFIVKDLFRGFEWNRIQRGDRTRLGSVFFAYAKNAGMNAIRPLDKTPQNQQKYIKI